LPAFGYFDATGIDDGEDAASPFGVGVQPVTGGTRHIGYDGKPPSDDAVE
jgi:hypothetical protein